MNTYYYTIAVECETQEQADRAIAERIGYDEDYGFYYTLTYENGRYLG